VSRDLAEELATADALRELEALRALRDEALGLCDRNGELREGVLRGAVEVVVRLVELAEAARR
jgi:hypothetical protein